MHTNQNQQAGYDLMAAAFEVHRVLRGGLLEEVYQSCLELELECRGIPFAAQARLQLHYKGRIIRACYVPDLLLQESSIVVELKSVSGLTNEHRAQLLNYMRIARMPVGYLINFAPLKGVEWERLII